MNPKKKQINRSYGIMETQEEMTSATTPKINTADLWKVRVRWGYKWKSSKQDKMANVNFLLRGGWIES